MFKVVMYCEVYHRVCRGTLLVGCDCHAASAIWHSLLKIRDLRAVVAVRHFFRLSHRQLSDVDTAYFEVYILLS